MRPNYPKILRALPLLLLPLAGAPARAAQTASVSGTPSLHASPDAAAPVTGHLPAGALVTLERCSTDLVAGSGTPGLIQPAPGAGDWCLVRGAGWVDAAALVNIAADPKDLFGGNALFDPLKQPGPAWDDPGGLLD